MTWQASRFLAAAHLVGLLVLPALAKDTAVRIHQDGTNALLQVVGDPGDDWRIEVSPDLRTWTARPELGTLLSAETNAPARILGDLSEAEFYRVLRTSGLYDPAVFRSMSLAFAQTNWQTLLTRGRTTGSNVLGNLALDNGAAVPGIGARYRGNTSFQIGGAKKSVAIDLSFTNDSADLMGFSSVNLNNAAGDETIMREPLYFTVMSRYAVSPKGALAQLYINGANWGVYSLAQQEDADLIKEWFPSSKGDRWRAPNVGGGTGGGGGGGGFSSPLSALSWQGTNVNTYKRYYELKKQNSTNAWENLVHVIDVLNNTPEAELPGVLDDVLAVDRWLWFLALENLFADDDSYWNKGADYEFYFEPESGRIHPVEHDGNEAFVAGDAQLSPVTGATSANRPVLYRLLPIPDFRQRYLAHMRTALQESYHPAVMTPLINQFHALSIDAITQDPKRNFSMTVYTNDLLALKRFITNRYNFLTNHAELRPVAPTILAVSQPPDSPAGIGASLTAQVTPYENEGIDSVWLYYRAGGSGKFGRTQMLDDGAHNDGPAGDGIFGAETPGFLAGGRVRYYIEARSGNSTKTASFAPARAEESTFSYRVAAGPSALSPVRMNEFMADNSHAYADPQGEFDDWIELHNGSAEPVDLTGMYLSDNPDNPRKWQFPNGTTIAPGGYLIVWADEDDQDTPGLHASFKLASEGEIILLIDTDARLNATLDSVVFGPQQEDLSYGRAPADPSVWQIQAPTPNAENR